MQLPRNVLLTCILIFPLGASCERTCSDGKNVPSIFEHNPRPDAFYHLSKLSKDTNNFWEAKRDCENNDAHLATGSTLNDYQDIASIASSTQEENIMLGLVDLSGVACKDKACDGKLTWIDGNPFDFGPLGSLEHSIESVPFRVYSCFYLEAIGDNGRIRSFECMKKGPTAFLCRFNCGITAIEYPSGYNMELLGDYYYNPSLMLPLLEADRECGLKRGILSDVSTPGAFHKSKFLQVSSQADCGWSSLTNPDMVTCDNEACSGQLVWLNGSVYKRPTGFELSIKNRVGLCIPSWNGGVLDARPSQNTLNFICQYKDGRDYFACPNGGGKAPGPYFQVYGNFYHQKMPGWGDILTNMAACLQSGGRLVEFKTQHEYWALRTIKDGFMPTMWLNLIRKQPKGGCNTLDDCISDLVWADNHLPLEPQDWFTQDLTFPELSSCAASNALEIVGKACWDQYEQTCMFRCSEMDRAPPNRCGESKLMVRPGYVLLGSHYYKFHQEMGTFSEANKICVAEDGHQLVVGDPDLLKVIQALIGNTKNIFLGLEFTSNTLDICQRAECDGQLTWVDGTLFKYDLATFDHLEDFGASTQEPCLVLQEGKMIQKANCNGMYHFICQSECPGTVACSDPPSTSDMEANERYWTGQSIPGATANEWYTHANKLNQIPAIEEYPSRRIRMSDQTRTETQ